MDFFAALRFEKKKSQTFSDLKSSPIYLLKLYISGIKPEEVEDSNRINSKVILKSQICSVVASFFHTALPILVTSPKSVPLQRISGSVFIASFLSSFFSQVGQFCVETGLTLDSDSLY